MVYDVFELEFISLIASEETLHFHVMTHYVNSLVYQLYFLLLFLNHLLNGLNTDLVSFIAILRIRGELAFYLRLLHIFPMMSLFCILPCVWL